MSSLLLLPAHERGVVQLHEQLLTDGRPGHDSGMATDRQDQYRAEFDATVTFSNGGGLRVDGSGSTCPTPISARADRRAVRGVAGSADDDACGSPAAGVRRAAQRHPRRSSEPPRQAAGPRRLVELSHVIAAGMTTYPGLPGPEITPHLTREELAGALRGGHRVRDRPDQHGRQHRHLPGQPVPPLRRRRRPGRAAAGAARRPARRRGPHDRRAACAAVDVGDAGRRDVAGQRCCCTPAATGTGARPTYAERRTVPDRARRAVAGRARAPRWSASTRSTSTTPTGRRAAARAHACCSPPASRSSSTSPAWPSCRRPAPGSPPRHRGSPASARSRSAPSPPSPPTPRDAAAEATDTLHPVRRTCCGTGEGAASPRCRSRPSEGKPAVISAWHGDHARPDRPRPSP